jgi:hypothetical protein
MSGYDTKYKFIERTNCPINISYPYSSKRITNIRDFPSIRDNRARFRNKIYPNEFLRIITDNGLIFDCEMNYIFLEQVYYTYYPRLLKSKVTDLIQYITIIGTLHYFPSECSDRMSIEYDNNALILHLDFKINYNLCYNSPLPNVDDVRMYYPYFIEHRIKSMKRFYTKYKLFYLKNINKLIDLYM